MIATEHEGHTRKRIWKMETQANSAARPGESDATRQSGAINENYRRRDDTLNKKALRLNQEDASARAHEVPYQTSAKRVEDLES